MSTDPHANDRWRRTPGRASLPRFLPAERLDFYLQNLLCRCGCGRPQYARGVSKRCLRRMALGLQPDLRLPSSHPHPADRGRA